MSPRGGDSERSPLDLAEVLWRSLNRAAGYGLRGENLYAGTFSEYGVGATKGRGGPDSPTGQAAGVWIPPPLWCRD